MLIVGFLLFFGGASLFTVRLFTNLFVGGKGELDEVGFLLAGLLVIGIANLFSNLTAAFACLVAFGFNAYVTWDRFYYPSSGVIKQHEIDYIFSKPEPMAVREHRRFEIGKDEKGMCKVTMYDAPKESFLHEPNADKYKVHKELGIGKWKYLTEDWLRHVSFLYRLFVWVREQVTRALFTKAS